MNPCGKCGKTKKLLRCGLCRYCNARQKIEPCVQCQKTKWIRGRGLCTTCYDSQREKKHCTHCSFLTPRLAKGLCGPCYKYRRENNMLPPRDVELRNEMKAIRNSLAHTLNAQNKPTEMCRRCKESCVAVKKTGLCGACHKYKIVTGKSRPNIFIQQKCTNCLAPTGPRASSGLCFRCYRYQKNVGRTRPEHVWKTVEPWLGWCECSTRRDPQPASHAVDIQIGTAFLKDDKLYLCDNCYAEHKRMNHDGLHFDNRPHGMISRAR